MPFKLGPLELGLILVVIFIIFGAGKLPQLFDSLGKGLASLKKKQSDEEEADGGKKRKASRKTSKKAAKS
jgi:sec-independent protein translocase protein TatA